MTTQEQIALSEREKEALRLLLVGHDAKSIANTLGLSVHTINDRLRDARRKLGVSSSREAARRLVEMEGSIPDLIGAKEIGGADVDPSPEQVERPASPRSSPHRLAWLTGGMLIMSLVIAAVALSTLASAPDGTPAPALSASTIAPSPAETEASSAARKWVALLDAGRWDASWRAAAAVFKAQLTSSQWATTIQSVRQPLGRVSSRALQNVTQTRTLPGAPAGDYQVLQFQTRFATKADAVETVVLSREKGEWRVSGYFIR
jgi:DNA-binding CsgD family transcriptional regulator